MLFTSQGWSVLGKTVPEVLGLRWYTTQRAQFFPIQSICGVTVNMQVRLMTGTR